MGEVINAEFPEELMRYCTLSGRRMGCWILNVPQTEYAEHKFSPSEITHIREYCEKFLGRDPVGLIEVEYGDFTEEDELFFGVHFLFVTKDTPEQEEDADERDASAVQGQD